MKQTTYLATLPNKVRKLGKSHRILAMAMYGAAGVSRDHSPLVDVGDTVNQRSFSMGVILGSRPSQALYIAAGSSVLPRDRTMCRWRFHSMRNGLLFLAAPCLANKKVSTIATKHWQSESKTAMGYANLSRGQKRGLTAHTALTAHIIAHTTGRRSGFQEGGRRCRLLRACA
jgi:hypothetical protein